MNFRVSVTSSRQFGDWVKSVEQSPEKLDLSRYREIEKPGAYSVTAFSGVKPGLFEDIMNSFHRP